MLSPDLQGLAFSPMSTEEDRRHESKGPSPLGRILAVESVCLWPLWAAVVARLMSGVALAPPLRELLLYVALPGLPVLGISCGALALWLGVRRWGWIGVAANALALLLMAAALAIFLYLDSQRRFTLGA